MRSFRFLPAPHYAKCKVLLVSGYRHLLNGNRSIQFPVLSLTGILISTCISVINTLGVYWQHHQWKAPESNRPHGLLVHLTVIAALRYTFPYSSTNFHRPVFTLFKSTTLPSQEEFHLLHQSSSTLSRKCHSTTRGEERNWTSIVYHSGTDLQSVATPPIVAASP